jgi:dTDP-4-dehydrorhamnose reductase/UDP-glucose 4-epimerase
MALDPRYMREAYDPALDFDLKVAEAAAKAACHFFMMSSRKVYGPARQWPLREDASKAPVEFYGRNKLETERRVEALLASNCTILRLANVFAFEPDRSTFFGIALRTLRREGCIILDSNPLVKKDFIPLTDCIDTIAAILPQMPAGIFNLGYGTATEIGQVARWLIEGYGRGELVVTSEEMRDEFLLDTEKLARLAGTPRERKSIQAHCLEIGEQLRHA